MGKVLKQIIIIAAVLFVVMLIARMARGSSFEAVMSLPQYIAESEELSFNIEGEDIISISDCFVRDGWVHLIIEPLAPGDAWIEISAASDPGTVISMDQFTVGRFYTVFQGVAFNGDGLFIICSAILMISIAALFLYNFKKSKGSALYSYQSIRFMGFGIFALYSGLVLVVELLKYVLLGEVYSMRTVFTMLTQAAHGFMIITLPFVIIFAVLMTVSNISLLRHEGRRIQNILGIIIGFLLVGGEALAWRLDHYVSGSETAVMIHDIVHSLYCTAFVYFECMLIGAIVCGVRAAKFVPDPDKDYIIILGCRVFKDGRLTPLLRGRVDKAVDFAKDQFEKTGKKAVLVPSGGKGSDEVISEGEAMKRYLLSRGLTEEDILLEDRAANTYENIKFSEELIRGRKADAKISFSTTNYHVFRSGLWAKLAGVEAEGMGSKTKWYFWPNAFMRECVGLLRNNLKAEFVLLVLFSVFYAGLIIMLN